MKKKNLSYLILICILFFGVQSGLQLANRSFYSEFGAYPDEAAHYLTGVMVHDYILATESASPMKFAKDYYIHYPKIAIGHWPPVFYVIEGVWMLLFSPSRISSILLMTFLTTLIAITLCLTIRKDFGYQVAIGASLLMMALPLVQKYSTMIMVEIPVALFSLWASLCFGKYLETEKAKWSVGFAICAALTILTKGNGFALAFVPLLGLFFSQRFYLIKRLSFWYPAMIVVVLCAPWYGMTMNMVRNGWHKESVSLSFIFAAIPFFSFKIFKIIGIGISILTGIGFISHVISPCRNNGAKGMFAASGALIVSVLIFHIIIPAGMEERHLITVVPALLIFFAAGMNTVAERLLSEKSAFFKSFPHRQKIVILMLMTFLIFMSETFAIPKKAWFGFETVAHRLLYENKFHESVFLISSDEKGEGMFISEIAMQEKERPSHIVLRASKVLAKSRWSGTKYQSLYQTPEEIMGYLKKTPINILVIDESLPRHPLFAHHHLLGKAIKDYKEYFRFLGSYSLTRKGVSYPDAIKVYQIIRAQKQPTNTICVNMSEMLGDTICLKLGDG